MVSAKSIVTFVVLFLCSYGTLATSWPITGPYYALCLRESGQFLLRAVGAHDRMRLRPATPPEGMNDTILFIGVTAPGGEGVEVVFSSWIIGFQSTSLVVALVVATPIYVRRRVAALLCALVFVHAFVLVRLGTFDLLARIGVPETLSSKAIWWILFDFVHGHGVSCAIPLLIWLVVAIRGDDLKALLASGRPSMFRMAGASTNLRQRVH